MPSPASLAERLLGAPGSKERFGASAAEVLEIADLVAAANTDWDKDAIAAFQQAQGIHPKVWGKLVAIARSTNLKSLPKRNLPASYTALYALEVMNDQELAAALSEGIVSSRASTRAILDWTKAYRLRGTGIEQEIPLTLVIKEDLTDERQKDLLVALQRVADQFGADVLEGKGGIKQAGLRAEARKALASEIEEELMRLIGPVVKGAPEDLRIKFKVTSVTDLIGRSREAFTGFFQVLEGKGDPTVFWRKYGRAYCLKIAYDFNLTSSRAERYQFKKRIEMAIERWGIERGLAGFKEMATEVLETYMGR